MQWKAFALLYPGSFCMADIVAFAFVQELTNFQVGRSSDPLCSVWQVTTAAPATCDNKLQGIMSWTTGCFLTDHSAVFTNIYSHIPWIKSIIST